MDIEKIKNIIRKWLRDEYGTNMKVFQINGDEFLIETNTLHRYPGRILHQDNILQIVVFVHCEPYTIGNLEK